MGKTRLATPELAVVMEDGSEFTIQVVNADLVSWERYRVKAQLPGDATEVPFTWMNYLAWHHLTKTARLLPEMKLGEFEQAALSIMSAPAAEEEQEEGEGPGVDPTSPEPAPE